MKFVESNFHHSFFLEKPSMNRVILAKYLRFDTQFDGIMFVDFLNVSLYLFP